MQQAVHLMPQAVDAAIVALQNLLGREHVITNRTELEFYSQDVYRAGQLPAAVIRPADTAQLSAALAAIAPSGLPIVPRGGGMS
ncbi:MAG: FAD-binding oxidoreductase, partial [Gammaproteobacteria bacterium]|nr:FAD-binding oxidoreductase [Gammaproteobacteria bacterium]